MIDMHFPEIDEIKRQSLLNPPPGKLRLVIDTDARNEVDDQFAIAWALRSKERFEVEAIYAVPFHHGCFDQFNCDSEENLPDKSKDLNGKSRNPKDGMEQSYEEILNIMKLMKEQAKDRVFKGADRYLQSIDTPVISDAAKDLVKRARSSAEPLYIAAIGALTNIASALLIAPDIIEHIVVVWLGGHELSFGHGIEFNLIQDVLSAQIVFDSGVPLIWVPCNNVASMLSISEAELKDTFLPGSAIAKYLAKTVLDTFHKDESKMSLMKLLRSSSLKDNNDQPERYLEQFQTGQISWSRIIWDIAVIAILKNPNWVPSKLIPTPVLRDDFTWDVSCKKRHRLRVGTFCHRDMIMGDLAACMNEVY